jgi:polyisoprenoid-binding protein YceI
MYMYAYICNQILQTMKKNFLLISSMVIAVAFSSCSGGQGNEGHDESAAVDSNAQVETATWVVDAEKSNIRWTGGTAGAVVYSHYGDIKVASGKLTTEGAYISAGEFAVDMTSIDPKDEGYSEEHPASDLVGHLSSPDFFNAGEFPQARFEVVRVEGSKVIGNLTIRGITHEEVIDIDQITMSENGMMKASGVLVFDRQKYNVAWAHYLKDTILSDDIKLEISLVATKA